MNPNEPERTESDECFEQQLREFRPIAPRTLAVPAQSGAVWKVLAFAGVLLAIGLGILHYSRPTGAGDANHVAKVQTRPETSRALTAGKLNASLRASDRDLDQLLNETSPRLLTREHLGTALYELSKE
jgi:hypothetical protein